MENSSHVPRRKSQLKCGRRTRSRSLGTKLGSCIHENIPASLSPEERLKELVQRAYDHTLQNIGQRCLAEKSFDLNDFISKGSKMFEDVDKEIKDKNLYQLSVAESEHERCDDMNCIQCEEIEKCTTCIAKLQHESNEWNRLFSSEREKLQDVVNTPALPVEHEVKCDRYSYSSTLDSMQEMCVDVRSLAKEFDSAHDSFKYSLKLANASVEKHQAEISGYLNTADLLTPRSLIKHLTSANKASEPPP